MTSRDCQNAINKLSQNIEGIENHIGSRHGSALVSDWVRLKPMLELRSYLIKRRKECEEKEERKLVQQQREAERRENLEKGRNANKKTGVKEWTKSEENRATEENTEA